MSHAVSNWAWKQKLPAKEKLVLVKLADSANDDGCCWPSLRTLEPHLGMSRATVGRIVNRLADNGLLRIEQKAAKQGSRRHNYYHLAVPWTSSHPDETTSDRSSRLDETMVVSSLCETEPKKPLVREAKASLTPKPRKKDPLWDTFTAELGEPATKSERGRRNNALKQLREIEATPDQLQSRIRAYRDRWPGIDCTETAIVANWTLLSLANSNGSLARGMVPVDDINAELRRLQEAARGR